MYYKTFPKSAGTINPSVEGRRGEGRGEEKGEGRRKGKDEKGEGHAAAISYLAANLGLIVPADLGNVL